MSEKGLFKTSMVGGFDKKDVLTYLDDISLKHHNEKTQLEERIAEINAQRNSFANQTQEDFKSINTFKNELEEALLENENILKKNEFLVLQNKNQVALLEKQKTQLLELQKESELNLSKIRTAKIDSDHLNDMNTELSRQVKNARQQSEFYIKASKDRIDGLTNNTRATINDMIGKIQNSKENISEVQKRVSELHKEFEESISSVDGPMEEAILFLEEEEQALKNASENESKFFSGPIKYAETEGDFQIYWAQEDEEKEETNQFNLDNGSDNVLSI